MACKKLFSGVLPEITNYIIQFLRDHLRSLYSCVLVNRHLCWITIPILWEDPFYIMRNSKFLTTYLLFLNDEDKARLKGLIFPSSFKKPLFNYPSFIKTLNQLRMQEHVTEFIENLIDTNPLTTDFAISLFHNEPAKLLVLLSTICELLFKLFISNDISLNSLYIKICHSQHALNVMIFNEICKKPKFLSDIKYFTLDFDRSKVIPHLPIPSFEDSPSAITSNKHFTIYFIAYLMSALKYCSNTLTSIKFILCNFNDLPSLNGLNYLVHLESLQFKQCKGITVQVFRPLLDISTPLKIKTLTLDGLSMEITFIQSLFQKIGSFLENLEIKLVIERKIIYESIINHCNKVQFLHISEIEHVDIVQLFKLITHVRKHLKYLSLQIQNHRQPCLIESDYDDQQLRVSSMILTNLGQILPDTLKYLELNLEIDPINLKIFLDNCKHIVGLNSLLVINKSQNDIIFDVLKEFVREKKVTNFAYNVSALFSTHDYYGRQYLDNEIHPFVKPYSELIKRISNNNDYFEI
ncbi:12742_t:CDS:2 [Funneliformis caledonium]|uniref:12742_t:CDS:1 n=1 Tax=Funneliformis caledonium TaxID=1117310 RepID=A0A9N9CR90_9GLOM|nr:12742_t:CDS:2 [Funneliformis caledonium]